MRIFVTFSCLTLLVVPSGWAEQPCQRSNSQTVLNQVKTIKAQLLAFKLQGEMDPEVPAPLQAQIRSFKESLAALAKTALQCAPEDANPKVIETTLIKLLDANKPVVVEENDSRKPPQLDHIYGDGIDVKVTAPENYPKIRLIKISFGIACSEDALLLAYELHGSRWQQVLRWQSGDYDLIKGAFGDFFEYQVVPQKDPGNWLVAVAHGNPWCSSNMSGFDLDLIQPMQGPAPQQILFHKNAIYTRASYTHVMKSKPDGFELRLEAYSMDIGIIFRPVIYRYRVSGNQVVRIQPIAMNGRDFVDEWLQSEWSESKNWSATSEITELEAAYKKIRDLRDRDVSAKQWPDFTYGPVRGCSDSPSHYQVELDEGWWVEEKKDWRPDAPTFFQIEEGKNSFTMLSASGKPDPHCTCHDIMPKR